MKVYLKIAALILTLVMMVSVAGCGGKSDSPEQDGNSAEENSGAGAEVSEDYFKWDGDLISALSESGMEQSKIVIPERCTGFNGAVFAPDECKVKEVSFESNLDFDMNRGLSLSDSIERISLPAGLTKISDMEFAHCANLQEITIPSGITDIGKYTFQDCPNLKTVVFEGALTEIKPHTFEMCSSLPEIILPDTITKIDEYAFYKCTSLKEVTLPAGLKEIGGYAFANSGLEKVFVPADLTLEKWDTTSFVQSDHDVEIYVAEGSWMDQNFDAVFDGAFIKQYTE